MHYVCGFMFAPDMSRVVLIHKIKPVWLAGLLNGIGGKVESGETSVAAMVREFEEETGLKTKDDQWTHFCTVRNLMYYEVDFYFCFSQEIGNVKTAESEQVVILNTSILPEKIAPNLHWLIPLALSENVNFNKPVVVYEQNPVDCF